MSETECKICPNCGRLLSGCCGNCIFDEKKTFAAPVLAEPVSGLRAEKSELSEASGEARESTTKWQVGLNDDSRGGENFSRFLRCYLTAFNLPKVYT